MTNLEQQLNTPNLQSLETEFALSKAEMEEFRRLPKEEQEKQKNEKLEKLKNLQVKLDEMVQEAIQTGKLGEAKKLKEQLEKEIGNLEEIIYIGESLSIDFAREIMEKNEKGRFFGPEEIRKALAIDIKEVPPIPFKQEELERAESLNQQLVLYTDKTHDDLPLTIVKMNEMVNGQTTDGGKLLYGSNGKTLKSDCWYKNEDFATKQTPVFGWRLTNKTELTDSTDSTLESKSKNYLEQTEVIIKYLKEKVFATLPIPLEFQSAIDEFERQKADIAKLISTDWEKASDMLEKLAIIRLTRESPVEAIYRLILTERGTKEKLLPVNYVWTSGRSSDGDFVYVGNADSGGVHVNGNGPGCRSGNLGASFSRSV